jgi:hypothetical protein
MDIHKPKPWHGVREFLKEYVIIVVGVLTALAAEQAVEWLHWRHETQGAMAAIRSELARDAAALQGLGAQDVCIDKRLALLADWSRGNVQINNEHLTDMDDRPRLWSLYSSAWEVAKTGTVAAHIPIEERNKLASLYDQIANQEAHIWRERDDWTALVTFAAADRLDAEDAKALRGAIAVIRTQAAQRRFNTPDLVQAIADFGIKPNQTLAPNSALCDPPK